MISREKVRKEWFRSDLLYLDSGIHIVFDLVMFDSSMTIYTLDFEFPIASQMVLVSNFAKISSDAAHKASKKGASIDLPKQYRVRDDLEQRSE